ncbi:GIN domain-containing protein [Flavobacterium commune]|uniref:DUF2807 domain-containing protein n=1 Tax=Flavobacterium commune TaxID=1306519 RepID=A0A1D9PBV7_9FLAO|nr:DUF2807 domain-containing protein [Flavobacterium commune]APA00067.1 DUF2807 domain-containing protein [Flavobacterium commune]
MKKFSILLLAFLSSTIILAQKKEKISGSKTIVTKQKNIKNFSAIEVQDNLIVSLERGEYPEIKLEADDNLIDIIDIDVTDSVLHLSTSKNVVKSKSLKVKITYTEQLNSITSKNEAVVNAIQEILTENLNIKTFDDSKIFMNAKTTHFLLQADGSSKIELNLSSEKIKFELTKNAELKSLVKTTDLAIDMYQKTKAKIEGEADSSIIRLENNSELEASKLDIKSIELITEGQSKAAVNPKKDIIINASEKSEIDLYGEAKIEMNQFIDKAKISKK